MVFCRDSASTWVYKLNQTNPSKPCMFLFLHPSRVFLPTNSSSSVEDEAPPPISSSRRHLDSYLYVLDDEYIVARASASHPSHLPSFNGTDLGWRMPEEDGGGGGMLPDAGVDAAR